ncbi:SRT-25 protein, partial [Aphelenchoides avenae]
MWYLESSTALLLAVHRCLDLVAPSFTAKISKGHRTWLLCMVPVVYAAVMVVFAKSCAFSSIYVTCSFNPHIGFIEDKAGQ